MFSFFTNYCKKDKHVDLEYEKKKQEKKDLREKKKKERIERRKKLEAIPEYWDSEYY